VDERLRQLERRWQESNSDEDGLIYLRHAVRSGITTNTRIKVAAIILHTVITLGEQETRRNSDDLQKLKIEFTQAIKWWLGGDADAIARLLRQKPKPNALTSSNTRLVSSTARGSFYYNCFDRLTVLDQLCDNKNPRSNLMTIYLDGFYYFRKKIHKAVKKELTNWGLGYSSILSDD